MDPVLQQLKTILTEEQAEALSSSLVKIVEEKAEARAKVIAEEQFQALKKSVVSAGEKFYADKLSLMRGQFASVAEEMVQEERKKFAAQLLVVEEALVQGVSSIVEEGISQAIPTDIANTISSARALIGIVEETRQVFERNFVTVDTTGAKVVSELTEQVRIAQEETERALATVSEMKKAEVSHKREADTLKAKLIIEESCIAHGIVGEQKRAVYAMMNGKSLSHIEKSVAGAISVVEESFGGRQVAPAPAPTADTNAATPPSAGAVGVVEEGTTAPSAAVPTPTADAPTSMDQLL